MLSIIDPSVVDESDPLSIDPSLDMYDPANGYRPLPEPSKYAAEFLARYRAAQSARVARIDAIARGARRRVEPLAAQARRARLREPAAGRACSASSAARFVGRYFAIHRTEANPAYTDLSSLPVRARDRLVLLAATRRVQLPRGGLRQVPDAARLALDLVGSRVARVDARLPARGSRCRRWSSRTSATTPCSRTTPTRSTSARPSRDKQIFRVSGDHLGYGPSGMRDRSGQNAALDRIVPWIKERFA